MLTEVVEVLSVTGPIDTGGEELLRLREELAGLYQVPVEWVQVAELPAETGELMLRQRMLQASGSGSGTHQFTVTLLPHDPASATALRDRMSAVDDVELSSALNSNVHLSAPATVLHVPVPLPRGAQTPRGSGGAWLLLWLAVLAAAAGVCWWVFSQFASARQLLGMPSRKQGYSKTFRGVPVRPASRSIARPAPARPRSTDGQHTAPPPPPPRVAVSASPALGMQPYRQPDPPTRREPPGSPAPAQGDWPGGSFKQDSQRMRERLLQRYFASPGPMLAMQHRPPPPPQFAHHTPFGAREYGGSTGFSLGAGAGRSCPPRGTAQW
jgi:hypothetical protein